MMMIMAKEAGVRSIEDTQRMIKQENNQWKTRIAKHMNEEGGKPQTNTLTSGTRLISHRFAHTHTHVLSTSSTVSAATSIFVFFVFLFFLFFLFFFFCCFFFCLCYNKTNNYNDL